MLQRTEISSLQYSITLEIQELLAYLCRLQMVVVAQLVRAPGCGPGGQYLKVTLRHALNPVVFARCCQ